MPEKVYCVQCGEDTEYDQGRVITISDVDGSKGHAWCIDKYDEQQKKVNVEYWKKRALDAEQMLVRLSKLEYMIKEYVKAQSAIGTTEKA